MEESRDAIRDRLEVESPPFAFPSGSFTPALVDMVRECGFRSVFQSRPSRRVNQTGQATPFTLSRVGLPNAPRYILEAELDGPFHAIRRLYHP